MQVKSIAECSKGSILKYFRPPLCYHLSLRSLFCLFLSGYLRQVLVYCQKGIKFTFFNHLFSKLTFSKTLSECQTVWIQIRTDVLLVLSWVQPVCKGYQQTTKVATSKEIENSIFFPAVSLIRKLNKFHIKEFRYVLQRLRGKKYYHLSEPIYRFL